MTSTPNADQPIETGDHVRFADGAMPSCDGIVFEVEELFWDNTKATPRRVAWLVDTADLGKAPSRRRRRSGYTDVLRTV